MQGHCRCLLAFVVASVPWSGGAALLRSQHVKTVHEGMRSEVAQTPIAPYSYTLLEPTAGKATRSLIILGPWNSTAGFMNNWVAQDFLALQPQARSTYRILDCVGTKRSSSSYPYTSWYEYTNWAAETPVMADVDQAVAWVHGLIAQELAIVGSYQNIVLAGFSQGANLALEAAFRFPKPLGLVFSQRGTLLQARRADWTTPLQATPIIFTAGSTDPVYPEAAVKSNCRWLRRMHVPTYMKTISALGHHRKSTREVSLEAAAFAGMTSTAPAAALGHLTDWTDCA